jgi:hypothetical protein
MNKTLGLEQFRGMRIDIRLEAEQDQKEGIQVSG